MTDMAEIAAETRTPPTDSKWYVVHAYSGHEEKVRANRARQMVWAMWPKMGNLMRKLSQNSRPTAVLMK